MKTSSALLLSVHGFQFPDPYEQESDTLLLCGLLSALQTSTSLEYIVNSMHIDLLGSWEKCLPYTFMLSFVFLLSFAIMH